MRAFVRLVVSEETVQAFNSIITRTSDPGKADLYKEDLRKLVEAAGSEEEKGELREWTHFLESENQGDSAPAQDILVFALNIVEIDAQVVGRQPLPLPGLITQDCFGRNKDFISFLFHQILFDKQLFPQCSFTCAELLSLLMVSESTRAAFCSQAFGPELMFFLKATCEEDPKSWDAQRREVVSNCFNILNYVVLQEHTCRGLLDERFTDMLVQFVKQKRFYSVSAIRVIHSFSSVPFAGEPHQARRSPAASCWSARGS